MTISYCEGSGLYINLTNRCTNDCAFCVRNLQDSVGDADSLWLEREPTYDEIVADLEKRDFSQYTEVVFCGYGEPMMCLDILLQVAAYLRTKTDLPIRINTNGHANLIYGEDVTPRLEGLIDVLSISLNSATAEDYDRLCQPVFGKEAYDGLLDFAARAKKYVKRVTLSVVDILPPEEIELCRKRAADAGVDLRVRTMIE